MNLRDILAFEPQADPSEATHNAFTTLPSSMGYTTRVEWSTPGESLWMRLSKFSLYNQLTLAQLIENIFPAARSVNPFDLRRRDGLDLGWISRVLEVSVTHLQAGLCLLPRGAPPNSIAPELRYCPACLRQGFHAAWFQCTFIERCPFHCLPLRQGCSNCNYRVRYSVDTDMANSPLACPQCQCEWVPLLFKPTGRCKPVSNDKQLILSKWQVLTESYASREDFHRQIPLSMLFEQPMPIPQTNVFPGNTLRIVNRLYTVPPPSVDDMWEAIEAQVDEPTLARNTNATKRAASYDRRRWRRLGEHFASLHQLVLNAWQHWFPEVSLTCRRGKHRGIVLNIFTVPSTQLTIHEAAALGWGSSWLGIHFLAPKDFAQHPITRGHHLARRIARTPQGNRTT